MMDRVTCACGCGRTFQREPTGRPRLYASDRCKEKEKRRRRKEDDRNAVARLKDLRVDEEGLIGWTRATCHICGVNPATRGSPVPLICNGCGDKGRDAA